MFQMNSPGNDKFVDVVVLADASSDYTDGSDGVYRVLRSAAPEGVTAMWNRCYKFWKLNTTSKLLILANNDILLGPGAIQTFLDAHARSESEDTAFVMGPLCLGRGCGKYYTYSKGGVERNFNKRLMKYLPESSSLGTTLGAEGITPPEAEIEKATAELQCILNDDKYRKRLRLDSDFESDSDSDRISAEYPKAKNGVLGYFMAFDRRVKQFEFASDVLFNTSTVNTGNEDRLWRLMRQHNASVRINTHCFVYHDKALTIPMTINRDNLSEIHSQKFHRRVGRGL